MWHAIASHVGHVASAPSRFSHPWQMELMEVEIGAAEALVEELADEAAEINKVSVPYNQWPLSVTDRPAFGGHSMPQRWLSRVVPWACSPRAMRCREPRVWAGSPHVYACPYRTFSQRSSSC